MEHLHSILSIAAEVIDIIGLAIIAIGTVKFLMMFVSIETKRLSGHACTIQIQSARRILGGYILVALEFMIVSDVITSVTGRSLEALAFLAGIVAIRTAIGYFLAKELENEQENPT